VGCCCGEDIPLQFTSIVIIFHLQWICSLCLNATWSSNKDALSVKKTFVSEFSSTTVIFYDHDYDYFFLFSNLRVLRLRRAWFLVPTDTCQNSFELTSCRTATYSVCCILRLLQKAFTAKMDVPTGYLRSYCVPLYRWYLTPFYDQACACVYSRYNYIRCLQL
jgi:hypothetical protein